VPTDLEDLIARVRAGEAEPAEILPHVYRDLRKLAASYVGRRPATLQPTELVHELFFRLERQELPEWKSRAHFIAVAATGMRQILVDAARKRVAGKRGGMAARVTLSGLAAEAKDVDVVALNQALERLAALDERAARLVEMRYFGGLTEEEVADVLEVGLRTVQKDWRRARAWLAKELGVA
jgi:RNA polymerase sigma factor (TIGR02999 family)